MKELKQYIAFIVWGAITYWVADIGIHFGVSSAFSLMLLTLLVPCFVLLGYFYMRRRVGKEKYPVGLPLFMLLGIWVFGPFGISIGAVSTGGTFLDYGNLSAFLAAWVAFPLTTWMMSAYSGNMGGLIISTLMLIALAMATKTSRTKRKLRHR